MESQQHEDAAGHERGQGEASYAVESDDVVDDHDEGPGRSADLHGVTAERRDEEAAYYGGDQT